MHLRKPAASREAAELPILFRQHLGPGPAGGIVSIKRAPLLAVFEIRGRIRRASALGLHATARDKLSQHLAEVRPPVVHRRCSVLCMHSPLRRVTADGLCYFNWTFREQVAPLARTV